ncbi:Acyl CoA binding protein [Carpediemonas membranifera]|uniref:Acyl CoA binding protein n=1 Tax=Carpediemonas membranifera TaxID=201153 RepID=A0A8J6APZ9_9EUKA|nr:Acyl CoA binding protein [Carpediemonas membranifera]|eukprot:KAG9390328.1 Acyl CoA binding protein [Carpediemonas membranifera]
MALQEDFEAAAEAVHQMTKRPSNEEFLKMYAMFKQAKFGDNDTPKPKMLANIKDKKKWEFWMNLKGKSQEDAMKEYIEFTQGLIAKYT